MRLLARCGQVWGCGRPCPKSLAQLAERPGGDCVLVSGGKLKPGVLPEVPPTETVSGMRYLQKWEPTLRRVAVFGAAFLAGRVALAFLAGVAIEVWRAFG